MSVSYMKNIIPIISPPACSVKEKRSAWCIPFREPAHGSRTPIPHPRKRRIWSSSGCALISFAAWPSNLQNRQLFRLRLTAPQAARPFGGRRALSLPKRPSCPSPPPVTSKKSGASGAALFPICTSPLSFAFWGKKLSIFNFFANSACHGGANAVSYPRKRVW